MMSLSSRSSTLIPSVLKINCFPALRNMSAQPSVELFSHEHYISDFLIVWYIRNTFLQIRFFFFRNTIKIQIVLFGVITVIYYQPKTRCPCYCMIFSLFKVYVVLVNPTPTKMAISDILVLVETFLVPMWKTINPKWCFFAESFLWWVG